jgi:acid stress-induced BolA-like protein IbaG/YrbA
MANTKRVVRNLLNSQKIRVILNGVHVYTTVYDAVFNTFGEVNQRRAVSDTLVRIGNSKDTNESITGIVTSAYGIQLQVDLV